MLKTAARILIILATVGGGSAGFMEVVAQFADSKATDATHTVLLWIGLTAYSLIIVAGLIFIHCADRTRTMLAALAIQIPWFDAPGLRYHLSSMAFFTLAFGSPPVGKDWSASLDYDLHSRVGFRVGGAPAGGWSIGINLFPLFVLLAWLLYTLKDQEGEV
jgi:hypothetical protein